jgi:ribosomal protein L22
MADEKDPKDEAAAQEKPKRRTARRKPKAEAEAAPATAAAATGDEPAAVEEPVAEAKPAAKAKPAGKAKPAAAADEAPAPKPRRTARRKAAGEAPAAKPRRAARDYGDTPPMVRAHAKYVRTSARKARLVCDHIRGKSVPEARAILAHASRDVARDWSKLLESAVANAEHNHELIGDELRIHAVKADEGPTLKRFRPRAMGRATKIRKRTSHLSITLTPQDGE